MKRTYMVFFSMFFLIFFSQYVHSQTSDYTVEVLEASDTKTILHFKLHNYTIEQLDIEQKKFQKIKLSKSASVLKLGAPELVRVTVPLIIPPTAKMKFSIVSAQYTELPEIELIPSKGNVKRNQNYDELDYTFGAEYQKDEYYPNQITELNEPYIFREFRGQNISLFPFTYNPVRKILRIYNDLIISVETEHLNDNRNILFEKNQQKSTAFQDLYQSSFANFSHFKSKNKNYQPFNDRGGILIVAPANFNETLQPFIVWKKQLGYEVYTVEYTTSTSETALKEIVKSYYESKNISFLLLVGDAEQIPSFMKTLPDAGLSACDPVYGHLAGDDSYPEVIVGRFSANTITELQLQVQKTIDYEKMQQINGNWLSKYLLIASAEGPGDNNEYDFEHLRKIKYKLLNYNYLSGNEMYDGGQGEEDLAGNPTAQMVIDALNEGRGMLNYIGHGTSNRFTTSGFSSTQVASLTNYGLLPFVLVVACQAGNFKAQTCLAEQMLRASSNSQPTGAVAMLASTIDQDWDPPMLANDEMIDVLTEQYSTNIKHTFGGIVADGCMRMNDGYPSIGKNNTDAWTIFGDPSLMIRTKRANSISATYPRQIAYGANYLQIACDTEGALVTLLDKYNDYKLIDSKTVVNQKVLLDLTDLPKKNSNLLLTISKYNCIPEMGNITVNVSEEANIFIYTFSVFDENENNAVEFGEEINFDILLKNNGLTPSTSILAVVETENSFVEKISNENTYSPIAAGEMSSKSGLYKFRIKNNIDDGSEIIFKITIQDTENSNTWTDYFLLKVKAPKPQLRFVSEKEVKGNGNFTMDAGETFEFVLEAQNIGNAPIAVAECILTCNPLYFKLQNQALNFSFAEKSTHLLTFNVELSNVIPLKTSTQLQFNLQAGSYATQLILNQTLRIQSEGFENQNFNQFNWQNSTLAWVIDGSEKWEGNFSANSGVVGNNQTAVLNLIINTLHNDSIAFRLKVSSEAGYDFLNFFIDNEKKNAWSGEVDWQYVVYPVNKGIHTFEWQYDTDASEALGQNRAWIDNVLLPTHLMQNNSIPQFVSIPIQTAQTGVLYSYNVQTIDADNDAVFCSIYEAPAWLNLTHEKQTYTLSGTPSKIDKGLNTIILAISDGITDVVYQQFTIDVELINVVASPDGLPSIKAYPNPASYFINLQIDNMIGQRCTLSIFDITGRKIEMINTLIEIKNRSETICIPVGWESGMYFLKIESSKGVMMQKVVIEK